MMLRPNSETDNQVFWGIIYFFLACSVVGMVWIVLLNADNKRFDDKLLK